mmetsp:Transcript_51767/g.123190  ORF Transcript_51767/g.123190 Transcript_51767/m.123190 type:complete len:107 (+) Transcript_51767:22-342(+)
MAGQFLTHEAFSPRCADRFPFSDLRGTPMLELAMFRDGFIATKVGQYCTLIFCGPIHSFRGAMREMKCAPVYQVPPSSSLGTESDSSADPSRGCHRRWTHRKAKPS